MLYQTIKTADLSQKYFLLTFIALYFIQIPWTYSITSPPSFIKEPPHELIYDSRILVTLECVAEGEPEPKYYWTKNTLKYDPSANEGRVIMVSSKGTLTITRPVYDDEGIYQCFATNQYGTAVSNAVRLLYARLELFPSTEPVNVEVKNGDPLTLVCMPPTGIPTPQVFWLKANDFKWITCSKRIMPDDDGNLHFAYVNSTEDVQLLGNAGSYDSSNNNSYTCMANNPTLNTLNQDKYNNLIVKQPNDPIPNRPPQLMWTTSVNTLILEGQRLKLRCIYSGFPAPEISWRRIDGSDFPVGRHSFDCFNHDLIIYPVRAEDQGQYECRAANGIAPDQKRVIRVSVEAAPKWEIKPENINAAEDENVSFECRARGKPKPLIQWFFNGVPIANLPYNERRKVSGNVITISALKKDSDIGVYQCNASNTHGYIYANAYLNILAEPPVFKMAPRKLLEVVDSGPANISCVTFGAPQPRVTWFKDGVEVTGGRYQYSDKAVPPKQAQNRLQGINDADQSNENSNSITSTTQRSTTGKFLIIQNVVHSDAGNYTCEAVNKFGSVKASGMLIVKAHTVIQTRPQNGEVRIGEPVVFRCSAVSDSSLPLEIDWEKNGESIFSTTRRKFVDYDNSDGSMLMDDITEKPEYEDTTSDLVLVNDIESSLHSSNSNNKNNVVTSTHVDNQRVFKNPIDNSLTITNTQQSDTASYTCVARTRLDEARATANLTVQDVPNPPTDITLVSCMSRSATISWKPNGDNSAPILRFLVQYNVSSPYVRQQMNSDTINQQNVNTNLNANRNGNGRSDMAASDLDGGWVTYTKPIPPGERQTVIPLKANANYTFRVRAENKIGLSPIPESISGIDSTQIQSSPALRMLAASKGNINSKESSFVTQVCSTPPDLPESNPTDVRAGGPNPNKLEIFFTPPPKLDWAGPGFHYMLKYRKAVNDPTISSKNTAPFTTFPIRDPFTSSVVLTENIPRYTPYEISLTSVNDLGQCRIPAIPIIGYSGEDVPTTIIQDFKLVDIKGPTSARVSWASVDPKTLNGEFKGFKILSWTPQQEGGSENARETVINDPNQRTALIRTLKPFSQNIIAMRVYNNYYDGPLSTEIQVQTPEGTPEMVEDFKVYALGSNALQLRWKPPIEPNGQLTGYRIFYSKVVGTDIFPEQELTPVITDAGKIEARIPGLQAESKYRVTIAATTSAGLGQYDWREVKTTRAGPPMPFEFTISRVEGRRANVTWMTRAEKLSKAPSLPPFHYQSVAAGGGGQTLSSSPQDDSLTSTLTNMDDALADKTINDIYGGLEGPVAYVQYREKGDDFWLRSDDQYMDNFEVIENLKPGTVYEFRVVAQNDKYITPSLVQEIRTKTTREERIVAAGWFVALMCALAVLLLIMIIICLIRRNRGGKYPVHEKERAKGLDPEANEGFDDFKTDEKTPFNAVGNNNHSMVDGKKEKKKSSSYDNTSNNGNGKRPSGSYTGLPLPPSESDSLAEYYAELETGRFDEDGSFIGQYGARNNKGATPLLPQAHQQNGPAINNNTNINNGINSQTLTQQQTDKNAASLATFV